MVKLLLLSVVFLGGIGCFARMLYFSIQHGQWLDVLLNWQNRLMEWDKQKKFLLSKPLGYCELCFAHFIALLSIPFYLLFINGFNIWQPAVWYSYVLWIWCYWSIAAFVNHYFVTKTWKSH